MIYRKFTLTFLFFALLTSFLSAQCPDLPDQLPDDCYIEAANRQIAECYAPTIHQMVRTSLSRSANGRADLIVSPFFDGDFNTGNNWENLDDYATSTLEHTNELDPIVYYSVVWGEVAWVITYGFYHARDYTHADDVLSCCQDNHENDFEGAIFFVNRSNKEVIGAYSIYHEDLKERRDASSVPEVFIDDRTHAVELNIGDRCIIDGKTVAGQFIPNPCESCWPYSNPHITYEFADGEEPFVSGSVENNFINGTGKYELEDIFGSHETSLSNLRGNPLVFNGNTFYRAGSEACMDAGGLAKAPWGWGQMPYSEGHLTNLQHVSIWDQPSQERIIPFTSINNPYTDETDETTIHINEDTCWDTDRAVNSVKLNNGAKLKIVGAEISFSSNSTLDLGYNGILEIENSKLTSCSDGLEWEGIVAESKSTITIKDSEISGAEYAVFLDRSRHMEEPNFDFSATGSRFTNNEFGIFANQIIFPVDPSYVASVDLSIDDCYFSNHKVGVASNIIVAGSRIENSVFENCRTGVLVNTCENLNLENNVFNNCSLDGVYAKDSYINIPSSTFTNNNRGILLESSIPSMTGARIGGGIGDLVTFRNNRDGLVSSGATNPLGVVVTNTVFEENRSADVIFRGENDVTFINNDVTPDRVGLYTNATGDHFNSINCNNFSNNVTSSSHIGISFWNDNRNTQFLENNFAGTAGNNVVIQNSRLANQQGSAQNPAANCFLSNTFGTDDPDGFNTDIYIRNSEHFNYHYFDDSGTSNCQEPSEVDQVYTKVKSDFEGDNCPEGIGIFGLIDPDGDDIPGFTHIDDIELQPCLNCIKSRINVLVSNIKDQGGDDLRTATRESTYSTPSIYRAQKELDQWINYGIYVGMRSNSYNLINDILTPLKDFKWQSKHYGIKMATGDLVGGIKILEAMPVQNLNQSYFKEVQQLAYKSITSKKEKYELSASEQDRLKMIALSDEPTCGYARSLYHELTGVFLPINIPQIADGQQIHFRSGNSSASTTTSFYPNPVDAVLSISDKSKSGIASIQIFAMDGRLVYQLDNVVGVEIMDIDVSSLQNGVYLLNITKKDRSKSMDKITIQH